MYRSIILLMLVFLLPSQSYSQSPTRGHNHHHHSHLDTDQDLELSPVRPPMASRTTSIRDSIILPTVPSFHDHSDLLMDYDDSYSDDYNAHESSGAAGTESQSTVSATEEDDEYEDSHDFHKNYRDRKTAGSSEIIATSFLIFLTLIISIAALRPPQ